MEEALTVWEMLGFSADPKTTRWELMPQWIEYLKDKKGVTRDTWRLLIAFTEQCPKDFSSYDKDGCWPSLIDDFVERLQSSK